MININSDVNSTFSELAAQNATNKLSLSREYKYQMIDNYIYLYHLNTFLILPAFPDSVNDVLPVNFQSSTPLSRSAPIYSYASSGPRSIQVHFKLHRDMMKQINYNLSNATLELGDDYIDYLIKALQAASLPKYDATTKLVNPPIVALRLGNQIFIKGIIQGNISLTYNYPILPDGKYSNVDVNFQICEIDPYDAESVVSMGSFRGLSTTLERNLWRKQV